jgi:hypothetical protein
MSPFLSIVMAATQQLLNRLYIQHAFMLSILEVVGRVGGLSLRV